MSTRHDALFAALNTLQATLLACDPLAAEKATERALQLLATTTNPAADLRLRPIFAQCQRLADELKAHLQAQLRGSAVSTRAAQAYEREVGERP